MRACLIFTFIITLHIHGQVPGKALKITGANQYVSFGEVLNGTRTISFWINPLVNIDSTNATETPILVRDENGPNVFGTGEFALFFGAAGTPHAGRLTFTRSTATTPFTIHSNQNTWQADRWYHVAAVLHPQQGMQLYINGVLQQDTDASTAPIYIRSEGATGNLYLGKWGAASGYSLQASIEELHFYNSAQSEAQIRSGMCKIADINYAALQYYYDFDAANSFNVPATKGNINGVANGLAANANSSSNAPVGEKSTFLYGLSPTSTLSISEQVTLQIDSLLASAEGVHLYATYNAGLSFPGSYPYFFGVWFTDTSAQYNMQLNYDAVSASCDSCSELSSRDHQNNSNWNARNTYADGCIFQLKQESPGAKPWREEYWVRFNLNLNGGLDDTISECEGSSIALIPTLFTGASYLWDDGSTQRIRTVDSTGLYYVTINWHGCTTTDSIQVIREYMPYFELPNDTSICAGDTLVLIAPLDIDSAIYNWGNGLKFGKQFNMYFAGTISLVITVGNCSWRDEITVDLIKPFQLNLGKDTTLCFGQSLKLETPPNVNYYWSNGNSSPNMTVFNSPQTVWVKAWNSCFEKTDTITIDYAECDCNFFMANSFSPNNDGINDFFAPVSECYFEDYELQIFNRWGEVVFSSNHIKNAWDGTYQGKALAQGTYIWQVRYKKYTWSKETDFKRGTVNLIR